MSNDFPYPVYPKQPEISLKDIYPIGYILILDSPLNGVDTWEFVETEIQQDVKLIVEWQGMKWEYLNDVKLHNQHGRLERIGSAIYLQQQGIDCVNTQPESPYELSTWDVSIRNQSDTGTDSQAGYNGENTHLLTEAEMPVHNHEIADYGQFMLAVPGGANEIWTLARPVNPHQYTNNTGGTNGTTQPHNNMPRSKRVYMYKRIE